jgi:hypothetical protein
MVMTELIPLARALSLKVPEAQKAILARIVKFRAFFGNDATKGASEGAVKASWNPDGFRSAENAGIAVVPAARVGA